MHAELVSRYMDVYGGDLSKLPDDDYTLWFIGQHIHRSGRYDIFPKLYFDLDFVGTKLRVTGPSDLLSDYRKYGDFLDRVSLDVSSIVAGVVCSEVPLTEIVVFKCVEVLLEYHDLLA